MGRSSEIVWLDKSTDKIKDGHFWCEVFKGRHLSVDFENGSSVLTVEGFRDYDAPLWKFNKWVQVNLPVEFPEICYKLVGDYPRINVEFIGDHIIEVHLRGNPDWLHGFQCMIPVWEHAKPPEGFKFIPDSDFRRKGFFVHANKSQNQSSASLG